MKFLVLILVVGGLLWWLLRRPGRIEKKRTGHPPGATAFVACAHCGVHVPIPDAVRDGSHNYCSDAHRLAGPRDHDAR